MTIRARYLALPLVVLCNSVFAADVNCDYSDKTVVQSTGQIEGMKNYSKEVTDYAEDKRVCAVKFDAKVGEKWYETKNFYIYGPDMSQTEACNKAKDKAKVLVLEKHAPQLVTSDVEHTCTEKTPVQVAAVPKTTKLYQQDTDPNMIWKNGVCYVHDTSLYPECHLYNPNSVSMHESKRHNRTMQLYNLWNLGTLIKGQFFHN